MPPPGSTEALEEQIEKSLAEAKPVPILEENLFQSGVLVSRTA